MEKSTCKGCCNALVIRDEEGIDEVYCGVYNPPFYIGTCKVVECGNKVVKLPLKHINQGVVKLETVEEEGSVYVVEEKKSAIDDIKAFFKKNK